MERDDKALAAECDRASRKDTPGKAFNAMQLLELEARQHDLVRQVALNPQDAQARQSLQSLHDSIEKLRGVPTDDDAARR